MGSEFDNQSGFFFDGMPNSSKSPVENERIIESEGAGLVPAPTVHQVQIALMQRIKAYGGGIKGVWKAIAPNLKYHAVYAADNSGNVKSLPRITEDSFRKQVNRLKKKSPANEKMTFGIKGNILLTLNILEILKIKSLEDLLGCGFSKPDANSLIIAANVNSESILEKMDSLENTVALSMRNKSRIPSLKVCRDWEQVLGKVKNIFDMMYINYLPNQNNISWDFYSILSQYANNFTNEIKTAIYICTLLNEFKEYFPQDILLHKFIESFSRLSCIDYNGKHKLIKLAHLFLLYFFLIFQRRFINTFLSNENEPNRYSPFIHKKISIDGKEDKSNRVNNLLVGKDNKKISLTEYIGIQIKEMQKYVMIILSLFADKSADIKALEDADIQLIYDIISRFISIYSSHTGYDPTELLRFIEQIKSLNDFYMQLSLGKPLIYFVTEDDINLINIFKQRLDRLYSRLSRLEKGLSIQ